jgi:ABC-type lipoprotein release transport system permease subunit
MSLVLLVGAGLLTESLAHLESQQLGLETQSRLIVSINPALAGYTPERLPSQLFGVQAYDPLILGAAVFALAATAVLAALIPARRAASIDPLRVLCTD